MDVTIILKITGIGILVAVAHQILKKSGHEEQATFVSIAGVIVVLLLLVGSINDVFTSIRSVFSI